MGRGKEARQFGQRVGENAGHRAVQHVFGFDVAQFAPDGRETLLLTEQVYHRGRHHNGMPLHSEGDGSRLGVLAEVELRLRHIENGAGFAQIVVQARTLARRHADGVSGVLQAHVPLDAHIGQRFDEFVQAGSAAQRFQSGAVAGMLEGRAGQPFEAQARRNGKGWRGGHSASLGSSFAVF